MDLAYLCALGIFILPHLSLQTGKEKSRARGSILSFPDLCAHGCCLLSMEKAVALQVLQLLVHIPLLAMQIQAFS